MKETEYISLPKLERHPLLEGCFIYYLYRGVEVVYIGSTSNLYMRLSTHSKNKDFDTYSFFEVSEYERFNIESEEIIKYLPIQNKSLPSSLYWSQNKAKANGIYARYFKEACKKSCVMFHGTVYVKSEYLVEYIGVEL